MVAMQQADTCSEYPERPLQWHTLSNLLFAKQSPAYPTSTVINVMGLLPQLGSDFALLVGHLVCVAGITCLNLPPVLRILAADTSQRL